MNEISCFICGPANRARLLQVRTCTCGRNIGIYECTRGHSSMELLGEVFVRTLTVKRKVTPDGSVSSGDSQAVDVITCSMDHECCSQMMTTEMSRFKRGAKTAITIIARCACLACNHELDPSDILILTGNLDTPTSVTYFSECGTETTMPLNFGDEAVLRALGVDFSQ